MNRSKEFQKEMIQMLCFRRTFWLSIVLCSSCCLCSLRDIDHSAPSTKKWPKRRVFLFVCFVLFCFVWRSFWNGHTNETGSNYVKCYCGWRSMHTWSACIIRLQLSRCLMCRLCCEQKWNMCVQEFQAESLVFCSADAFAGHVTSEQN